MRVSKLPISKIFENSFLKMQWNINVRGYQNYKNFGVPPPKIISWIFHPFHVKTFSILIETHDLSVYQNFIDLSRNQFIVQKEEAKFWPSALFNGTPTSNVLLHFRKNSWNFLFVLFYGTQFFSQKSAKNSIHLRNFFQKE